MTRHNQEKSICEKKRRWIWALLPVVILAGFWFYFSENSQIQGKYLESEEFTIFENFSGNLRVKNLYGIIRVHPSKDDSLHVQANKFIRGSDSFEKMRLVTDETPAEVIVEVAYDLPGGKNRFTDVQIETPKAGRITVESSHGNLWLQDLSSELIIIASGKDQVITCIGNTGEISLEAPQANIHIFIGDGQKLKINGGDSIVQLIYEGKYPGPSEILTTGGQVNLFIVKDANAQITTQTQGMYFSNLEGREHLTGKEQSDGTPRKIVLGENGETIRVVQQTGEINLDYNLPPRP